MYRIARDKKLAAAAEVTLVDSKDFFESNIWALRAAVDPKWGEANILMVRIHINRPLLPSKF